MKFIAIVAAIATIVLVRAHGATARSPLERAPTYLCNYAKVSVSSSALNVRSRPSAKAKVVERLKNGADVYVCDEMGVWLKIVFWTAPAPCSVARESGMPVNETQGCRSGWVRREGIEIISG